MKVKNRQFANIALSFLLLLSISEKSFAQTDAINTGTFFLSSGTVMLADGAFTNNGTATNGGTFYIKGALILSSGTFDNTGTLKTQNTSATPIPAGQTWAGTVEYNGSGAQSIVDGYYTGLNGTGGNRTLSTTPIYISETFTPGAGTYTITGSTINYNSSSAQDVAGFNYNNLIVSGGNTKALSGAVSVRNELTLEANTTLALGSDSLTLKSDSGYTARVTPVPTTAAITYGSGRFIAERYIQGRRKFRLITSPVTTSTSSTLIAGEESLSIWGNWQNGGINTTPNVGNFITGGSGADGFDTQIPNASLYTYDAVNRSYVGHTTANGKNTKYTPLKAGVAYYMFVYGDRLNTVFTANPHNTVLSATGTIKTGDQTYNTASAIPLSAATGRYTLLGNPFASPIDWALVDRTNISNAFWGWDPNLNNTGGYVTVSTTGTVTLISPFSGTVGLNQYIQSGQGFFVKTTGASPSMTIKEADKVSNFNDIAFFTEPQHNNVVNNIPLIAINLQYPSGPNMLLADGALTAFDNSFNNTVGPEDATKVAGSTEVLAIENDSVLLSIDGRKMPQDYDTIFINLANITRPQYSLQIFANQMYGSDLTPFLEDIYLNTSQPLSLTDTNNIVFNVESGVPASSAANRFRIVFRDLTILPVTFRSVKASQKGKDNQVEWSVAEESSTVKYQIEHSANGTSFTVAGQVNARGLAGIQNYQWLHVQPATGNNYYRVKAVNADGKFVLSNIVQVKTGATAGESSISVHPNPVLNQQLTILLSNMPKGQYPVKLVNLQGQVVYTQNIYHNGGTSSQIITLSRPIATGIYYLVILGNDKKYTQKLLVEK